MHLGINASGLVLAWLRERRNGSVSDAISPGTPLEDDLHLGEIKLVDERRTKEALLQFTVALLFRCSMSDKHAADSRQV